MMTNATAHEDDDRPPDPDEEAERIERLIQRHAAAIAEHVDTVRIFITKNRGNGSYGGYSHGEGNYFAQRDSVRDWLIRNDQATRNEAE